jgi:hypothetical protein
LPSIIEGTVWHDRNRSGTSAPDTGEEWLASVVVTLTIGVDTYTTTTDSNGYFQFIGNYTGTFTVTVDADTGDMSSGSWTPSYDTSGHTVTPHEVTGTVVTGGRGRADYSYYQTGSYAIGDKVYKDWDGDGVEESGETGISSVTVWLYEDSDGDGVIDTGVDARMLTATTSITGWYRFNDLPDDDYIVVVDETDSDLPSTYSQTADPDEAVGLTSTRSTLATGPWVTAPSVTLCGAISTATLSRMGAARPASPIFSSLSTRTMVTAFSPLPRMPW